MAGGCGSVDQESKRKSQASVRDTVIRNKVIHDDLGISGANGRTEGRDHLVDLGLPAQDNVTLKAGAGRDIVVCALVANSIAPNQIRIRHITLEMLSPN
jgi:hypothetical protein